MLSVAPESNTGLFYVALGLFHKEKDVRTRTVELLERISEHEAGRHWWTALSRFEKLAFIRIKRESEAASHADKDEEKDMESAQSPNDLVGRAS